MTMDIRTRLAAADSASNKSEGEMTLATYLMEAMECRSLCTSIKDRRLMATKTHLLFAPAELYSQMQRLFTTTLSSASACSKKASLHSHKACNR